MHAIRKTPSPPFSPHSHDPLLRYQFPPLSTLCDLMKLPISLIPHRFTARSSRHSIIITPHIVADPIQDRDTITTPHASGRRDTMHIDTAQHTAHAREARNLFSYRSWTAVAPSPTQPDSQPKSISVALPTATQTRFMPFP